MASQALLSLLEHVVRITAQMPENLGIEGGFMAHGYCFAWETSLVALHALSDVVIGLAYYAISAAIFYFAYRRRDLPFLKIILLFGVFILACGTTHFFGAYTIFRPTYWLEGYVKAFTALVTILAAILFIPLLPEIIALPSLQAKMMEAERLNAQLRVTDETLQKVLDAILWIGEDGRILRVNESACRAFGYSEAALLQLSIHDLDPGTANEGWRAHWTELKARGARRVETQYRTGDGRPFMAEISSNLIASPGKEFACLVVRDITQRMEDKNRLEAETTKLRTLLRSIPDLVWLKDPQGVYQLCNQRFEAFFGSPEDQILGKTDYDFVPKDLADFFRGHDLRAMNAGKLSVNEEWVTFASDGHQELLETIKTPVLDAAGQCFGVLGIARDITRNRQDQDRLRKLSRAIEHNPDVVVITDRYGAIEYVNPRFAELTGYTEEETLGQNPRILKSSTMPPEVYDDLWTTILAGKIWQGELQNRKKSGELYWEATSVAPIFDDEGAITHFVAIKHDITARKQAEAALRESEESYRLLFENMLQGVFFQRADGALVDVNPAALAMLGLTRDQFLGRSSSHPEWKVVGPDGTPLPLEAHASMVALSTGKAVGNIEIGVYRPDRQDYVWLVVNAIPRFRPGDTQPFQAFVTLQDISVRKQSEQHLAQQKSLLDATGRVAQVGGWELDLASGHLTWTEEVHRIHELNLDFQPTVERAIGFYVPEAVPVISAAVQRAIEQGEPFDLELQILTAKGNRRWVRAVGEAVFRDGKAVTVRGAFQNIHASQVAKEALAVSHALNETLLKTIPFPMDIVDERGGILFMSHLMEQVVGQDWQGKGCWALYKDDHEQCSFCPLKQPIEVDRTSTVESTGVLGGRVFEITHTGLIFNGQKALMEVFIDITERKRIEEERTQQLGELRRWHEVTLGRETRVADLKCEVNELLGDLGRPPRYRGGGTEPLGEAPAPPPKDPI